MKLTDKLTELGYVESEENVWRGVGVEGKSDIYVGLLEDSRVEVVVQPSDLEIPATVITFSKACDALYDLLERKTW